MRLQVETLNITNVTRLLSELTWYHNGTVMLPNPDPDDQRITFSVDKKTLTIANFSSTDAGVYKVQFNKIDVQPYCQTCNDELISLLRGYPILAPAVYCINVNPCTSEDSKTQKIQRVNVSRLNLYSIDGLMLAANGMANNAEELKYLSLKWYRNGRYVYYSQYYKLNVQKQYPMVSQEINVTRSEVVYEETGRYEVALTIYIYDPDSKCQAYYGQLLAPYGDRYDNYDYDYEVPLSWGYVDVSYYKSKHYNITFNTYREFLYIILLCMTLYRCGLIL